MSKVWVVTREINEYNQDGEYFVAVFKNKPTFQQLKKLLNEDDVTIDKLTRGGGRQSTEYEWYNLLEEELRT